MKFINKYDLARPGVELTLFPDNQPHVRVLDVEAGDDVRVVWPLCSSLDVLQLAAIANALTHLEARKTTLVIPYLLGARSDRPMRFGDSVDLEVVGDIINACGFEQVYAFDVHNFEAAAGRIKNFNNYTSYPLVTEVEVPPDSVLIVPDQGATRRAELVRSWQPNLTTEVYCTKERNLDERGRITLSVSDPDTCRDRHCFIFDDLCDGGGTFLAIAGQIQPKSLTLVVSHGVFSRGLGKLTDKFDRIYTTDSYPQTETHPKLTVVPLHF